MQASVSLRLVLILGLLSAIGPFAIDMYLPALPQIGASLGAEVGAVQASLTAFFLSIGVDVFFLANLAEDFLPEDFHFFPLLRFLDPLRGSFLRSFDVFIPHGLEYHGFGVVDIFIVPAVFPAAE